MLTKLELKFPQSMTFMRSVHWILHNIMCYSNLYNKLWSEDWKRDTLYCDIVEFILRFLLPVINKRGQEDKAHQQHRGHWIYYSTSSTNICCICFSFFFGNLCLTDRRWPLLNKGHKQLKQNITWTDKTWTWELIGSWELIVISNAWIEPDSCYYLF